MGWRPSGRYTPAAKRGKLGSYEAGKPGRTFIYLTPSFYFIIPSFHYSCLEYAGWVLGIPYYQQFVEFPGHLISQASLHKI